VPIVGGRSHVVHDGRQLLLNPEESQPTPVQLREGADRSKKGDPAASSSQ